MYGRTSHREKRLHARTHFTHAHATKQILNKSNVYSLFLLGQVLNHFMEQAQRLKQIAREKQADSIEMGIPIISDNTRLTFTHLTESEWSWEVEKFCGRPLSKSLVRHLCQDAEIVPSELVPTANIKVFKNYSRRFPEVLAIKITSEADFDILIKHEDSKKKLDRLCPVTFQQME
jgi:hypothetical protein